MNSGNLNGNSGQDREKNREEIYKAYGFTPYVPPPPPEKLSAKQVTAFTAICAVAMLFIGLLNCLAPSDDAFISLCTGTLSLISYVIIGGIYAMLVLDSPRFAPISPIIAFVGSLALSGASIGQLSLVVLGNSLMALLPFVGGLALAIAMKSGARRSGAILASAVAYGIFTALVLLLVEYLVGNTISIEAMTAQIDASRQNFITLFEAQVSELSQLYDYDFSQIDIKGMVNGIFNVLPAIFVITFSLIAFFAQLTLLAMGKILNLYHKFEKKDTEFTLSTVTAVVFALSYILSVVLAADDSAAAAVFDNLSLMLMLPLALTGLLFALPKREGNMVRVGCFPLITAVILLAFYPSLGVIFLAFWGAFFTIKTSVSEYKASKNKNKNDT